MFDIEFNTLFDSFCYTKLSNEKSEFFVTILVPYIMIFHLHYIVLSFLTLLPPNNNTTLFLNNVSISFL